MKNRNDFTRLRDQEIFYDQKYRNVRRKRIMKTKTLEEIEKTIEPYIKKRYKKHVSKNKYDIPSLEIDIDAI